MSRRFQCPWSDWDDSWIDLPDEWLGSHAERYDKAITQSQEKNLTATFRSFALSIALLDDWRLPGLEGNPDKWDFGLLPLQIIAWVSMVTLEDYNQCWQVPKNSSPPLPAGQTEVTAET